MKLRTINFSLRAIWASLVAQTVKRLPAMRETQVRSLGRKIVWRRKWQPTPVLLPGKFHGMKSLVGYNPWDCKESDTTERLQFSFQFQNHNYFSHHYVPGTSRAWNLVGAQWKLIHLMKERMNECTLQLLSSSGWLRLHHSLCISHPSITMDALMQGAVRWQLTWTIS